MTRNLVAIGALIGVIFALFLSDAKAHVRGCHSRACDRRISAKRHRLFWVHRWNALSAWERTWARCIADHETRGFPWPVKARVATGNGYYGSTQWLPATWHAAGGSGLPTQHSLHEQLVRTVRWAHIAGSAQWSTSRWCGSV